MISPGQVRIFMEGIGLLARRMGLRMDKISQGPPYANGNIVFTVVIGEHTPRDPWESIANKLGEIESKL